MTIAANKVKGIRCALCSDTFSAHATREHNDANILAFGERVVGEGLALDIVDTFVKTKFSNAPRHIARINKITAIEQNISNKTHKRRFFAPKRLIWSKNYAIMING